MGNPVITEKLNPRRSYIFLGAVCSKGHYVMADEETGEVTREGDYDNVTISVACPYLPANNMYFVTGWDTATFKVKRELAEMIFDIEDFNENMFKDWVLRPVNVFLDPKGKLTGMSLC